jgi:hypothetical protein
MSDSVLHHLTERVSRKPQGDGDAEDIVENYGAFGWLRGVRDRALYLELRRKDGNVTALGYPWLESIEFNPSVGVTLKFTGHTVIIRGRNLNAEYRPNVMLINGILRHKVPWVQEADYATSISIRPDKHSIVIESIELD